MRKTIILILLASLFLFDNKATAQTITDQGYEVYSRVFDEFLRSKKVRKKKIVLIAESDYRISEKYMALAAPEIVELASQLDSLNIEPFIFSDSFKLRKKQVILISNSSVDSLFKERAKDGWVKFYKKHPKSGGILRASRILYTKDSSKCLLYISIMRGGLTGGGYYVFFDLINNEIISTATLWQA